MGLISRETLSRISSAADIVSIVSRHVALRRSGKNFLGRCPFHPDKTPSFTVSPQKQIFHCFGCQMSGDVFSFLQKIENIGFTEAVEALAKETNIPIAVSASNDPKTALKKQLLEILLWARDFYRESLKSPQGAEALRYLESRGLSPKMAERFQIGWAPPEGQRLVTAGREKGVPLEKMKLAGLAGITEEGRPYDLFRGRILFPIHAAAGRVVGFGGRILRDTERAPKYLNSPETLLFSKGRLLYGLHLAGEHISKKGRVILLEGYMDVIAAHEAGFEESVGVLGTALTQEHIRLLSRFSAGARPLRLILLFDSDTAGRTRSEACAAEILTSGLEVLVAELPPEKDPDEFLIEKGSQALEEVLARAKGFIAYKTEMAIERHRLATPTSRGACAKEVLPWIAKIPSPLIRSEELRELSGRIGVTETALIQEMPASHEKSHLPSPLPFGERGIESSPERLLLRAVLEHPECLKEVSLDAGDFSEAVLGKFYERLISLGEKPVNFPDLLQEFDETAREVLCTIALTPLAAIRPQELSLAAQALAQELRRRRNKMRMRDLSGRLSHLKPEEQEEFQKLKRTLKGSAVKVAG